MSEAQRYILFPTKTRLALLASVGAEKVYRELNTGRDLDAATERLVANALYILAAAGWVELEQRRWCTGPSREISYWRLTATGRAILAERCGFPVKCTVCGDPAAVVTQPEHGYIHAWSGHAGLPEHPYQHAVQLDEESEAQR